MQLFKPASVVIEKSALIKWPSAEAVEHFGFWKISEVILKESGTISAPMPSVPALQMPFMLRVTRVLSSISLKCAGSMHTQMRSSGILPTWHKRVHACLNDVHDRYVLCYSTYLSCTLFRNVCTILEMYRHVHTFLKKYKHVCTWCIHVYTFSGINMYVHRSDMHVHVCTSINEF
jgi:hypothetical protein